MQYVINSSGERVSVILPTAKYEALLSRFSEGETAYLLREPNGSVLLKRIENIRQGCGVVEQKSLLDQNNFLGKKQHGI